MTQTIACPDCDFACPAYFRFCGICGRALASSRTPEAERRLLTVMFVDMVGSSQLSERLDAEALRDHVREYQRVCARAIESCGGYVAQYLGDGVLAYFGYPVAHGDDARRAAMAARAILEQKQQQVRIGLHTGPVVIGEMGAGRRHERLALGEVPNLAARLEGLAEPGQAVMSERTANQLASSFHCEPLGEHSPRGFSEPQALFALGRARKRPPPPTPFVGRGPELEWLGQLWERAGARRCQIVAEAGLGKTRLVEAFVQTLEARVVVGLCSPFARDRSLFVLEQALGVTGYERVRQALNQPGLLWLEDCDWLDATSRELVGELDRVMVVMTARRPLEVEAEVLELGPLTSPETELLLASLGKGPELVERSGGIPLFIEELARSGSDLPDSLQASLLAWLDRAPQARPLAQWAAIFGRHFPRRLLARLWQQDDFDELVQSLEETGVLVGWQTDQPMLGFGHGLLREAAYESLLERDRRGLHGRVASLLTDLEQERPELVAHHWSQSNQPARSVELWRRAARRERSRGAEAEATAQLQRALEGLGPEGDELALRLELLPALTATVGYSDPATLANCQRILELGPDFRALKGLWSYHFVRAELEQAQRLAEQLLARAEGDRFAAEGHWTLGLTACCSGRLQQAQQELELAYQLYQQVDAVDHVRLFGQDPLVYTLCHLAWLAAVKAEPVEPSLVELRRRAEQSGHPFSQITALLFEAWVEQLLGHRQQVEELAADCLELSREHRSRHWVGFARALLGWARRQAEEVEAGVHQRERLGAMVSLPYLKGLWAECLGHPQSLLVSALEQARATGQLAYVPDLLCRLGRFEEALEVATLSGARLFQARAQARQSGVTANGL
ncbi:MAG: adenylate/guanylate cyclase domain-containing protein [Vulcanimicrobiota bacterium]